MATLKDVRSVIRSVDSTTRLVGASEEFMKEWTHHGMKLGETMMGDFNLTIEQVMNLPEETVLGEKAERAFAETKRWLASKSPYFKSYAATK